jgi:subtilisin family serine protease
MQRTPPSFSRAIRWTVAIVFAVIGVVIVSTTWTRKHLAWEKHDAAPYESGTDEPTETAKVPETDVSSALDRIARAGTGSTAPDEIRQAPAVDRTPSDAALEGSALVSESWTHPDAVGNRERIAIIRNEQAKYPLLRVVERWSGKTGRLVGRTVSVADHVLLAPKPGIGEPELEERLAKHGFSIRDREPGSFLLAEFGDGVHDTGTLPAKIREIGDWSDLVAFSEPDYLVWPCLTPNDHFYATGQLWGLHNSGRVAGYKNDADIDGPEGWNQVSDASSVIVAVTDTGIQYQHEDLVANLWTNSGETQGDGIDNDDNGIIDDIHGFDAIGTTGNPMDFGGHGTHCAGTIGARGDNGIGVCGVAWRVKLMGCRFLGPAGGTTSDGIRTINYAREKGAGVISASWGGGGYSLALRQAIKQCAVADIPFVAAAGNSGTNNDSLPHYPSSYNLPNIVAVAATGSDDALTGFSCYGRSSVDIAAPGSRILSCYIGSTHDYQLLSGTSMATPHVSGALALARVRYPNDNSSQLIERLYQTADPLPSLTGKIRTGARLNLGNLLNEPDPTPLSAPNDAIADAYDFPSSSGVWTGSNTGATREANEDSWSGIAGNHTVWFSWSPTSDSYAQLVALSVGTGQRIAVFEGTNPGGLKLVADSGPNSALRQTTALNFSAKAGHSYQFVAACDDDAQAFSLTISSTALNDNIESAVTLVGESFEVTGSTLGATAQPFEIEAPHAGVGAGHSQWFRWIGSFSGTFSLLTQGSESDTVVAVYQGNPSTPSSLSLVAANDDVSPTELWSRADFEAVEGQAYFIAIDCAMGSLPGDFVLTGIAPLPPTIRSQPLPQTAAVDGRAVFTVEAGGSGPFRYQWSRDGEDIPGAWERSLVVDPVKESDYGAYRVTVSNAFGSVTSLPAELGTAYPAPRIVWTSGSTTASIGDDVILSVRSIGAAAQRTYSWYSNGELIVGADSRDLAIPSVATADAGTYQCVVSNKFGTDSAALTLWVTGSPWDNLEWRGGGRLRAPITDLRSIDGWCVAVSADRFFHSTDGFLWNESKLPPYFIGLSVAKLGSTWICSGSIGSTPYVTTSTDGFTWTTPVSQTGILDPVMGSSPFSQITVLAGRLVGKTKAGRRVHYSSDGIHWTPAVASYLPGTVFSNDQVIAANSLEGDGIRLVQESTLYNPTHRLKVMVTTDGMTWQEQSVSTVSSDQYESIVSLFHSEGEWNMLTARSGYTTLKLFYSADAITWQSQSVTRGTGLSAISTTGLLGADLGDSTFLFYPNGRDSAWGGIATLSGLVKASPSSGENIILATGHGGDLVFATNTGRLANAQTHAEVALGSETYGAHDTIEFLNGEFIASGQVMQFSGDGVHWRPGVQLGSPASRANWFHDGRYYGRYVSEAQSGVITRRGFVPEDMTGSLPNPILQASSFGNHGNQLYGTAYDQLVTSTDNGVTWSPRATAPFISTYAEADTRVAWTGGLWWLAHGAETAQAATLGNNSLYTSSDGLTWTGIPTVHADWVVKMNAFWFAMGDRGAGAPYYWSSVDGTNWSEFAAIGLPSTFTMKKLLVCDGSLVLLLADGTMYHSPNGADWTQFSTPSLIRDCAAGKEKLVMLPWDGYGLLEAGPTHAGGSAPELDIRFPTAHSRQMFGSYTDITGTCRDPEGQPVQVALYNNGSLVEAQTVSGDFVFRMQITEPTGHHLRITATDAAGLVTSASLEIAPTIPQTPNLLAADQGLTALQASKLISFQGQFYALGTASLLRSPDGLSWEPVAIPSPVSATTAIKSIAATDGVLLLDLGDLNFASTRNGIDWSTYSVNMSGSSTLASFGLIGSPHSGKFYFGLNPYRMMVSANGIDWTETSVSGLTIEAPLVLPSGILLQRTTSGSDAKIARSTNDGLTWEIVPEFSAYSGMKLHATDRTILAVQGTGSIWSSSDGLSWTPGQALPSSATVVAAGDSFIAYVGSGNQWFVSRDGLAWTTGTKNQSLAIPSIRGDSSVGFIGRAYVGSSIYWSPDGIQWQLLSAPNAPASMATAIVTDDGFLLVDDNRSVWKSDHANHWTKVIAGGPSLASTLGSLGNLVPFQDRYLVGGNMAMASVSRDFREWTVGTLNGAATAMNINPRVANSTRALAILVPNSSPSTQSVLCRSTDGIDWLPLASNPGGLNFKNVTSFVDSGNRLIIADTTGKLATSTDDGATWSALSVPGLAVAKDVEWFNQRWIILGSTTTDSSAPQRVFHSTDGIQWTQGNTTGLTTGAASFYQTNLVAGHGKLMATMDNEIPVISTDGLTWVPFGTTAMPYRSRVAAAPDGWIWFKPSTSSVAPAEMKFTPPSGTNWNVIPCPSSAATGILNLDGVLFVSSPTAVYQLAGADFAITLSDASTVTLGVGDTITGQVIWRNSGTTATTAGFAIDAWLTPDPYFGDADDIYLGRAEVVQSAPEPGSELPLTLNYELPDTLRPGDMYLAVKLVPLGPVYESSISNNMSVSRTPFCHVPQRRLHSVTQGNGRIDLGQTAEFYPNKARISSFALPGKGARFAGWGGDAVGTLSEVLLVMDSDKTIIANFIGSNNLTVFTRGAGSVTLDSPDGSYADSATASLQATPADGWIFAGWTGALSGNQPTETLLMDQSKSVGARFLLPLESWGASVFSESDLADPLISGPGADPDADGIENWREWLHGSDPKDRASTGVSPVERDENWLIFTYSRMAVMPDGYSTDGLASTDLADWNLPLMERVIGSADGIDVIEARLNATGHPKAFITVRDVQPSSSGP